MPISHSSVVLLAFIGVIACEIPSYIKVCERSNPDLRSCINNSVSEIIPFLKKGIPELGVPSLEPLLLDNVQLRESSTGAVGANLSDLTVWGASDFRVMELRVNLDKNLFRFRVLIPKLTVLGKYETDSKLLFVNIKGSGPMSVNITDLVFDCAMKGHKIERDGNEYLEFEKLKVNLHIRNSRILLENLFNGDPVLGRATNDVINENIDLFLNEITPALQNSLGEKFTDIANKITLRFTYKELFP